MARPTTTTTDGAVIDVNTTKRKSSHANVAKDLGILPFTVTRRKGFRFTNLVGLEFTA
jgi:hypothetical protein